jgi:hypothetical protein
MNKKIKKPIKLRKKITKKKQNHEKNRLKFWKNLPVRFWFYKSKTEKTEPNPNRKKPKKIEPNRKKLSQNRAMPVWTGFVLKNRTKPKSVNLNQVRFFLRKNNFKLIIFLIKTEPNIK